MAKEKFERKWKVRNLGGGERYTHERERIEIQVNADKSVKFDVTVWDEEAASWGKLEDLGGVFYDKDPGLIFGTFLYKGTLHVYWMALDDGPGRPHLTCHVDDVKPDRQNAQDAKLFQPGSWVAEDDLGDSSYE